MTSYFDTSSFSNSFSNPYLGSNPASLPGIGGFTKLDYVNSSLQFARPEKEDSQSSLANYVRKLAQWHDHGRKPASGPQPRSRNSTVSAGSAATATTTTTAPSKRSSQQYLKDATTTTTVKWQDHEFKMTPAEPQTICNNPTNHHPTARRRRERSSTLNEEEEERYGRFYKELSFPHSRSLQTSSAPSPSSHINSPNIHIITNNENNPTNHHHHISIVTAPTPISTTAHVLSAELSNLSSPLMPSLSSSSSSSNASNSNSNSEPASSYPSSVSTFPPPRLNTSLFPTPIQTSQQQQQQQQPSCFRQKSKSVSAQGAIPIRGSYGAFSTSADNPMPNPLSPAASFLSQFVTSPRILFEEEGDQVGRYILGKVIGRGGFSTVREAYEYSSDTGILGRKVACKVVTRHDMETSGYSEIPVRLDKEVATWRNLSHPSIVKFLGVEESSYAHFVFSEYCSGGDLLHHMTSSGSAGKSGFPEDRAREIFLQICEAVRYLHEDARVCHKDIKLENILIDDTGLVKLADFGLAEWMDPETEALYMPPRSPMMGMTDGGLFPLDVQEDIVGGSLAYTSPEQLRTSKVLREPATDIWSLGVVLYALVSGKLPFMDEYEPRLQYKILNVRYQDPADISPECRDLIHGCFKAKPDQRLDIRGILGSDWFCM